MTIRKSEQASAGVGSQVITRFENCSYRSRWHSCGRRKGHQYLDHPEKFLDNAQNINLSPRMLLERFRLNQASLFQLLADIDPSQAWFNPVRDYNDELKQGKGTSP